MNQLLIITSTMTLITLLFTPLYFFYRHKMTKVLNERRKKDNYFRNRNNYYFMAANFFIGCVAFVITLLIYYFSVPNDTVLFSLGIYDLLILMSLMICVYGNGLYVTAVLSEKYIKDSIKRNKAGDLLTKTEALIHGPLSHILMYSGFFLTLTLISLRELESGPAYSVDSTSRLVLIVNGLVFGGIFGISQVINITWKHQLLVMSLLFNIYIAFNLITRVDTLVHPFNIFYFTFAITSIGVILCYELVKGRKVEYIYDSLL